jgi:HD-like signal output (HDOD) protein
MEPAKTLFQQKLSVPVRLSPMVLNIQALMDALGNEALTFRQLAETLSQYPVIIARLLSLANSAWAAPPVPVTSAENACARLGASVVKSMSIAFAVASSFNVASCPAFDNERFWTNSILVSEGAYLLANKLPKERECCPKTTQTAGILHNLGLLWFAEHLPAETSQALRQMAEDSSLTLNEALMAWTGGDYCQVGAWIAKQWQLPEVLVVALQYHRDENYRDASWETALCVGSALKMVTALSLANTDNPPESETLTAIGIDQAQQMEIFQQLASKYEPTLTLAKELFL